MPVPMSTMTLPRAQKKVTGQNRERKLRSVEARSLSVRLLGGLMIYVTTLYCGPAQPLSWPSVGISPVPDPLFWSASLHIFKGTVGEKIGLKEDWLDIQRKLAPYCRTTSSGKI